MEAMLTDLFTNPDNLWYVAPLVAHHKKKFNWRCYSSLAQYRRVNKGKIGGRSNWLRRWNNRGARCHWGHKKGKWRKGGPNVL